MEELIKYLPDIILYIVVGFIIIRIFHFIALMQNSTDIKHILSSALVIGYIYCNIAYCIPISINYYVDHVLIVLSSVVVSFYLGRFIASKKYIKLFDKIGIRNSFNTYMWDDLMDQFEPMKIIITYDAFQYEGMIHNFESYSNSPHITLASYIIRDTNEIIIKDYTNDPTKVIILDASSAKSVEIIYSKNSAECQMIEQLCNYHMSLQKDESIREESGE